MYSDNASISTLGAWWARGGVELLSASLVQAVQLAVLGRGGQRQR